MSCEQKENTSHIMWLCVERQLVKKEISQSELARRAGVNRSVISSLKKGQINKPSFDLACKLADALEISLDDLREDGPNGKESV